MEESKVNSFPSMGPIAALYPAPQIMLGRRLYWTEKRDGSQLRVWSEDGDLKVATSHQEVASVQFINYFLSTKQAQAVRDLVTNEGAIPGVSDFGPFRVFGELLVKGKSPARYEMHEETEFIAFDLYDLGKETWLPVPLAYQTCLHFGIPFVEIWGESQHQTLEELLAFRDEMLALATERGREGVVVKTLSEYGPLYAKEKRDAIPVEKRDVTEGRVLLPTLPDSEAHGAVAKAHADLGEGFIDKSKAMPLIAKYIGEEQTKHLCGKPAMPFFWYYAHYLEGIASG